TTISGGTLAITGSGQLNSGTYSGAISIGSSSTFKYSSSANQTLQTGVISGAGNLTKDTDPSSVLTLSATNAYTGTTTINAGTLSISTIADGGSSSNLGAAASGNIVINGGILKYTGSGSSSNRNITLGSSGGTIDASGSGTLTLTGGITPTATTSPTLTLTGTGNGTLSTAAYATPATSGTSALTKSGTGTWTLSFANTYTGATTISAGTLAVTVNNALGTTAGSTTIASGATLDLQNVTYSTTEGLTVNGGTIKTSTGTSSFAGAISLGANSTVDVGGTQLTLSGIISGGFGLTKTSAGILVLSNSNSYTGATTISAGTLTVSGTLADTTAVTVSSGTTYNVNADDTIGSLAGGGTVQTSGTVTLTSGEDNTSTTFSGVIQNGTGTLSLTKSGSGNLTLSGANTYTGATTISAGTLTVSGTLADTTAVTVSSGATYNVNANDTIGLKLERFREIMLQR
ncbi:MAG: hypothetical protein EB009_04125, partial [Actinobacteria bacterium]|nr:hypothetical protein [Actinomycetota bacterium]